MNETRFIQLMDKYKNHNMTEVEAEELRQLLHETKEDDLASLLADEWLNTTIQEDLPVNTTIPKEQIAAILAVDRPPKIERNKHRIASWIAAVAALFVAVLGGIYYFDLPTPDQQHSYTATQIDPPKDGIYISKEDGRSLRIDQIKDSIITDSDGSIIHIKDGQIQYRNNAENSLSSLNKISTSSGQQYKVELPDGTTVWLNAQSAITFPSQFSGDKRKVSIEGEAYFEVAKDEKKPFVVQLTEQLNIEVIGTHFNVNAYANNSSIKTTLIEGKVRIINATTSKMLQPGEQARVIRNPLNQSLSTDINIVEQVNISSITAWMGGVFYFDNLRLDQVVPELERWYDIQVVFESKVPTIRFMGEMDRDLSLTDIQKMLSDWGIETTLKGKKLIVK